MDTVYELLILSAMALYIGDCFIDFFKEWNKDVVVPLLKPFSGEIKEAEDFKINVLGIHLNVGKVFVSGVRLVSAMIFAVVVLKLLKVYASGWIKKIYK